jgi:hypothetical protein
MRVRLLVLAAAMVAVLVPPAWAQEITPAPTPTPTPTVTPEPTPTPEEVRQAELRKRKDVKRVYRDYELDGELKACKHKRLALKRTLRSVDDLYDADYPEFKPTLEAAIEDYAEELRRCAEEEAEAEETPTPAPAPQTPQAPAPTPAPAPPPPPTDSGDVPDFGGGGGGGNDDPPARDPKPAPEPPGEGDVAPVQPDPTPAPPPAAPVEPQLAVTSPGDSDLLVPALLLAAALLGLGLTGASAIAARRGGRLAGWGHAWREAAYRTTGAWGDFADWLRFGR